MSCFLNCFIAPLYSWREMCQDCENARPRKQSKYVANGAETETGFIYEMVTEEWRLVVKVVARLLRVSERNRRNSEAIHMSEKSGLRT